MARLGRIIIGTAIVGTVAIGALAVIAGPTRLRALWSQTTGSINGAIDEHITDPVALRAQLKDLEAQFPRRIAAVRADLAEVRGQLSQLSRERQIALRVSELAEKDLNVLRNVVSRAEEARVINASSEQPRAIEIAFNNEVLTLEQAYTRAADVSNTRTAYAQRVAEVERDAAQLGQQEQRLAALLSKLEAERADFQVQVWQLDRQVDSIARNERMIAVLNKRQSVFEEHSRYTARSVDQVSDRIATIRARQEGELAALAVGEQRSDYEAKARTTLSGDAGRQALMAPAVPAKAHVPAIRFAPKPGDDQPRRAPAGPVTPPELKAHEPAAEPVSNPADAPREAPREAAGPAPAGTRG